MKVLITGSSGFIGTNFIRNNDDFEIIKIDLLIQKACDIDFKGIDCILHLAAIVHQKKQTDESLYFKINRDLAFEVAKYAKDKGVKHFVLMSTAKVFGESTIDNKPFNEHTVCKPDDAYANSKLQAEEQILMLHDEFFKVAIIRSPLVYGPGVKANMYNLVKLVDKSLILPLGGINNKRSIVFIGNLVALLKHVIKHQSSGVFIAGDKYPVSTTQIIEMIAESFRKRVWLIKMPNFINRVTKRIIPTIFSRLFGSLELDTLMTNKTLNFSPPVSSRSGINEMVKWYIEIKNN